MSGSQRPDDTGCTVIHVDMDAFYVAVAIRDRPDLQDRAVIAGGGSHGVVLSATYPAREYGVRSAMPMTRARRLCPHAIVVQPDYDEVAQISSAVMETFRSITPKVETLSMDEAFLDVSGSLRRFGSPTAIGEYLRVRIFDEQRVTCSVGIAETTQLAKLASRRAKPDGLFVVPRDGVVSFLHPLAVEDLWGVGEKTAGQLHQLGLRTVGDLAHTPLGVLRRALGHGPGSKLHALAWGQDDREVVARRGAEEEPDRSIGHSETFHRDTDDPEVIYRELLRLSTKAAARMRAASVVGRTITVTVRFSDFTTITRSRTLRDHTDRTPEIYATAADVYAGLGLERARVRLVGVRIEGLVDAARASRQLMLGERPFGWEDAERAVDRVAGKFGTEAIRPATLLQTTRP